MQNKSQWTNPAPPGDAGEPAAGPSLHTPVLRGEGAWPRAPPHPLREVPSRHTFMPSSVNGGSASTCSLGHQEFNEVRSHKGYTSALRKGGRHSSHHEGKALSPPLNLGWLCDCSDHSPQPKCRCACVWSRVSRDQQPPSFCLSEPPCCEEAQTTGRGPTEGQCGQPAPSRSSPGTQTGGEAILDEPSGDSCPTV